jgi:hypothetical protein
MVRMFYYTCLLFVGCFLCGCGGPLFKMQLPSGVGSTFRSGKMHSGFFSKTGTGVMEYRVEQDSVIYSDYGDTTITFGIIFPRSKMAGSRSSRKRMYRNDSLRYQLFYDTKEIYSVSESRSLLTDIILPPNKDVPGYDEGHTNITSYYKYFKGYALCSNERDTAFFAFEQTRAQKELDTAFITGYIAYHNDSFLLRPFYHAVTQNAKENKFIFMLEGYGLYKQNQLFAFLQHAPLIEPGHEKLQLYNSATPEEQMLLAAYLTLLYDRL